jgi:hypothetical protein
MKRDSSDDQSAAKRRRSSPRDNKNYYGFLDRIHTREEMAIRMMKLYDYPEIAAEFAFSMMKDVIQTLLPQPIHEEIVLHLIRIPQTQ